MFTPMTQTKTVSTRINENVHNLFTEYCNQKGRTMSEMLSLFIKDIVKQNKDSIGSLQCSIESDEKTNSQSETVGEVLQKSIRVIDDRKKKDSKFDQELVKFLKSLENRN